MGAAFGADAVLLLHLAFILWAVFGGLAVVYRPRAAWLHLPALAWSTGIELTHGICPLTRVENSLRLAAGEAGYSDGCIDHYVVALVYPKGLTASMQLWLAAALVTLNVLLYGCALLRSRR